MVRISKFKHTFEKGYTPTWTTEIFTISKVKNANPVTYLLKDYREDPMKVGFHEYEFLKILGLNIKIAYINIYSYQNGNLTYNFPFQT